MNTNNIAIASELSDQDLLARLTALAGKEREATVELLAHLAALDMRPSVLSVPGRIRRRRVRLRSHATSPDT